MGLSDYARNNPNTTSYIIIFVMITAGFGLFGGVFNQGINLTKDVSTADKTNLTSIFVASIVMVFIMAILSVLLTKTNPAIFQTYTLVVLHLSLALSLVAVSYGTLHAATTR